MILECAKKGLYQTHFHRLRDLRQEIPPREPFLLSGTALSQPGMLRHQPLETVACQLQWSVPSTGHARIQAHSKKSPLPQPVAVAANLMLPSYFVIGLILMFPFGAAQQSGLRSTVITMLRLRSNKRGGSQTKFSLFLLCVILRKPSNTIVFWPRELSKLQIHCSLCTLPVEKYKCKQQQI